MQAQSEAARRYATALFELAVGDDSGDAKSLSASAKKTLNAIEKDLDTLDQILRDNADLRLIVASPRMKKHERMETVLAIAAKLKAQKLTVQFLTVLMRNQRLSLLRAVISAFRSTVAEFRGEQAGVLTSAHPLDKKTVEAIEQICSKATGKTVALSSAVDPELIGGFRLQLGSFMHDFSVAHQLTSLAQYMKGARHGN